MTYDKFIVLSRSDLKPQFAKLPIEMISSSDFLYPPNRIENAETLIFREGTRTIVLKDVNGVFNDSDIPDHVLKGMMIATATKHPKYREFCELILGESVKWNEPK